MEDCWLVEGERKPWPLCSHRCRTGEVPGVQVAHSVLPVAKHCTPQRQGTDSLENWTQEAFELGMLGTEQGWAGAQEWKSLISPWSPQPLPSAPLLSHLQPVAPPWGDAGVFLSGGKALGETPPVARMERLARSSTTLMQKPTGPTRIATPRSQNFYSVFQCCIPKSEWIRRNHQASEDSL